MVDNPSDTERNARREAPGFRFFLDGFLPGVTLAVAIVALMLSLRNEDRTRADERRAIEAERRAHADFVVFHEEFAEPVPGGLKKPPVVSDYVLANFGRLPIRDAEVRATYGEFYGRPAESVTDFGTLAPCEVATVRAGSGRDPYVVFTDPNGNRWSRRPTAPPRLAGRPAEGIVELKEIGAVARKTLTNCPR